MGANTPSLVLDSHAFLSHLLDEPSAGVIGEILDAAREGQCRILMSAMSVGETCYIVERRRGVEGVQAALSVLQDLPVHLVDLDRAAVLSAAHVKAQHPIAFADAFVVALALAEGATIVTGDPEFREVERLVPVRWLAA